jgi:vacuolar-type H+-ATPase subunit I/STV1
MSKKQSKNPMLEGMIQQKKAIEGRLNEVVIELSKLGNVQALVIASGDARSRLESFIHLHGGGAESKVPESRKAELRDLKAKLEQATAAAKSTKEHRAQLTQERDDLKEQLANFEYLCTEEELLGYLKAHEEAKQKTADLRAAITKQDETIREANAGVPSMGDLLQQREDLLADIAMGNASGDSLETLDAQIGQKEKEIASAKAEAKKIVSQAQQVIAGLKRKMTEMEAKVKELKEEILPEAIAHFLLTRAETACEEYVQIARELIEKHRQIVGLGTLLKNSVPCGKNILAGKWNEFRIPAFDLKACEGHLAPTFTLFKWSEHGNDAQGAAEAERQRIKALGIDFV